MRLPLATDLISRDGTTNKDAKIVNGFVEVNGDQPIVRKRFGYDAFAAFTAGVAQLMTYFASYPIAIIGDTIKIFTSGSAPTDVDPNAAYVNTGFDFEGANGSTAAATDDIADRAYTLTGTGTISTAQYMMGDSSMYFAGDTAIRASAYSTSAFDMATSDFTIEFWCRVTSIASLQYFMTIEYTSGFGHIKLYVSAGGYVNHAVSNAARSAWASNAGTGAAGAGGLSANTNTHIAFVRDGTTIRTYVGGVQGHSASIGTDAIGYDTVNGMKLTLGGDINGANDLTGWMDGFRIYEGVCKYPSGTTFTPPTDYYTALSGVVSTSISPTTSNLQYSAQDNGANAQALLFLKNRQQAWTLNSSGTLTAISSANYPGNYAVTLVSLTRSGTTATATLSADTNFQVGSTVTIAGATPSDYNGAQVITSVTPSVSASEGIAITITRSGTTATATVATEPHGFVTGQTVTIVGANQTEYNGAKVITVTSPTTFTFTVTVTSGGPATPSTGTSVANIFGSSLRFTGTLSGGTTMTMAMFPYDNDPDHIMPKVGDTVTLVGFYDAGGGSVSVYDGSYTVVSLSGTRAFTITVPALGGSTYHFNVSKANPTVSSITLSGNYATATTTGTKIPDGTFDVTMSGSNQSQYNGTFTGIYVSDTSFKYQVSVGADSPVSPATGTITASGTAASGPSFTFTIAGSPTTPATGTITATGGRTTVPGVAYMDGYFFVMDIYGVIYNSDLNSPGTWNALDYITAESQTGNGKALAKSLNYIVAFKEWSTEFFYNAGNTNGSPLDRVDNGFTLIGCASGTSIAELDGSLLWVSQSRGEGRGVYAMQGIQQAKISTPDIERILNEDDLATVYAYGIKIDGHALYVLTLITSDITLVYDATTKTWAQWSSLTAGSPVSISSITQTGGIATVTTSAAHGMSDGDPATIAGATQSGYNGTVQIRYLTTTTFEYDVDSSTVTPATGTITVTPYTESYFKLTHYAYCGSDNNLALHVSNGTVYNFDESFADDDGVPINLLIRTAKIDDGTTTNKVMGKLEVIGNKADTSLMIRWTNDDYVSYSAFRSVDLNNDRSQLRRCGDFRRRAIELRHVDDVAVQLGSLEI